MGHGRDHGGAMNHAQCRTAGWWWRAGVVVVVGGGGLALTACGGGQVSPDATAVDDAAAERPPYHVYVTNERSGDLTVIAGGSDQVVATILANKMLMQRPVVVAGDKAIIGRPKERIVELLR